MLSVRKCLPQNNYQDVYVIILFNFLVVIHCVCKNNTGTTLRKFPLLDYIIHWCASLVHYGGSVRFSFSNRPMAKTKKIHPITLFVRTDDLYAHMLFWNKEGHICQSRGLLFVLR